ncbi:MAG: metallophosphoesterase [Calditrichaeota bacterium]|nr:metallophosphoesterase [Calditrichota bacterium]
MKKFFFIFVFVLFIAPTFIFSKTLSGTVFHDLNKNQKLDAGEPGIPGVMVSNQKDVVATDENGHYKIKVSDETIIFISKPAGWMTPVNENNIPQFYYIHQPKGSPKLKHAGIPPTGTLPDKLNFPLYKDEESGNFSAIIFGDPQSRNEKEIGYLRDDVITEMVGTDAKFMLVLGDIVFDNLKIYDKQNAVLAQVGIPVYYLPGNHDENYDAKGDHYSNETYKKYYGPNYYSFDYGKVHFVALDDVYYLGKDEKGHVHYKGLIGEKQLAWVKNDLAHVSNDKLVVVAMHIPLYYGDGINQGLNVTDREKLFTLLYPRKHLLALAGHMHIIEHYFLDEKMGWQGSEPLHEMLCAAGCGAWWSGPKDYRGIPLATEEDGTPNGYHIFTFSDANYSEKFKPASKPATEQMRISYPRGVMNSDSLRYKKIIVNVYDGSEKSVTQFSLDNAPWLKMTREKFKDPYFDLLYSLPQKNTPSWINPKAASHIWTAPLPEDLPKGIHKIIVKTSDQFGNSYQAARIFEVK